MNHITDDYIACRNELIGGGLAADDLDNVAACLVILGKQAERCNIPRGMLAEFAAESVRMGRRAQRGPMSDGPARHLREEAA